MKKCLLLLLVVMLNFGITQAQNQGYQWSFGTVPPVASNPAIQGSAGSYPLTTLGGVADIPVVTTHTILSKSPGLGASCTGPISVDSIDAPSGLEFSNAPQFVGNTWTIEMAVNFTTPPGDYRKIFGFDDLLTLDGDKGVYLEAGTQELILYDGASIFHITGGAITSGTWNYLVFTRDGATGVISYYLNGALIGNYIDAANVFVPKASNTFKINFFKDDGTEESDVEIAKLGIYNRTLTASEIVKRTFNNICNTTHLLAPNPNEGHQWTFASAPFVSTPAVAASTGTYTLANLGDPITTGTTEDPDLG
ncbi:MAG TPA: LamG-like jellyroll fold domain-containing protein, partial [Chitinophagaceae bacterium]|nr:LamG-like jellyroll fold domain-containing protein [Chitinophagaceae bacterium]